MVKIYSNGILKFSIGRYPPSSGKVEFKIKVYVRTPVIRVLKYINDMDLSAGIESDRCLFYESKNHGKIKFSKNRKAIVIEDYLYDNSPKKEDIRDEGKRTVSYYFHLIEQIGNVEDLEYANKTYPILIKALDDIKYLFPRSIKLFI